MSEEIYVGIDIAKEIFYVATCPNIVKTHLPNTRVGHLQLLRLLQKQPIALIVLEAVPPARSAGVGTIASEE